MALTFAELEAITTDYFMADNKKAIDLYFKTSFLLNRLLKQQKGIWERPPGGMKIRIPLEYDGQEAGFYSKGDTISSDDRESLNAAYFEWKHAYGNATVYRIDTLKNAGAYAEVQLTTQRVAGAQKSLTKLLAGSIYDAAGGASNRLTGLLACCNSTATLAYGSLAENDLVAQDGTKPWKGQYSNTGAIISLSILRDMASLCKLRDGADGKPNLMVTTEALFNVVLDILQVQQRFTESKETVNAGFTGLSFEGKEVFPDDFCPSGTLAALNETHIGFAVHPEGYFMRSPWKIIPDSAEDKTMKIYFDGNLVVNNRQAHMVRQGLTVS